MVEIFFVKRFLIEYIMPYIVLSTSVFYLLLEIFAPRSIKEHLYIYLDRIYCKFVIGFIKRVKFIIKIFISNIKLNIKNIILKHRERLKKKEEKKNEKSKVKLNKRIDKINSKVDRYNKKVKNKKKRKQILKGIFFKNKKV